MALAHSRSGRKSKAPETAAEEIWSPKRLAPAVALIGAALTTAIPIMAHDHLPLVDLPNHIARLYIAASDPDGPLGIYYDYEIAIVPNAAADLLWYLLGHPGSAANFAQALLAIYAANLITAAMVLGRVLHGRWTSWPAAVGLVVYSAPFFWGFQNFVFSLPFVLYGLALWIGTERWGNLPRMAAMMILATALFLMHFFGFAILAIAVFGREIQVLLSDGIPTASQLGRLAFRSVPFIVPVAWLTYGILTGPASPMPPLTHYGIPATAALGAMSPVYSHVLSAPFLDITSALVAVILLVALVELLRRGGLLRLDRRMVGPAIALGIAALAAPFSLNGVAWVQIRVPVVLVLILIAGSKWIVPTRISILLALIVSAVMLGRGIALERQAAIHSAEIADLLDVGAELPPGARVLPILAPGGRAEQRLFHVQAHLVVAYDVFVPSLFQGVHMLSVREAWVDHAHWAAEPPELDEVLTPSPNEKAETFVQNWETKYTHATLFGPLPNGMPTDPRLTSLAKRGRVTLFSVKP